MKSTVRDHFLLTRSTAIENADSAQDWWACGPAQTLNAVLVGQKLENLESPSKAEDRYTYPVARNPPCKSIP